MKVAMIDPSSFTLFYDRALCAALRGSVDVDLYYGYGAPSFEEQETKQGNRVFYSMTNRFLGSSWVPRKFFQMAKGVEHLPSGLRLLNQLESSDCDLIHFQWFPLPLIDRLLVKKARRAGIKTVATVHDTTPYNASPSSDLQLFGWKEVYADCDQLIVHSQAGRDTLVNGGFRTEKISIIPVGVDEPEVEVPEREIASPEDTVNILFFGTLKPYKGVEILIEALGQLSREQKSKINVKIAGKAFIELQPLLERIRALGLEDQIRVESRFFEKEEIPPLYLWADIMVFPYRVIDTSAVLMSALPYGAAIVASKVGGFPEVIEDKKNGLLVPPEDAEKLGYALGELIDHPIDRQRMGKLNQQIYRDRFQWDKVAEKTMQVYKSVLSS